MPISPLSCLKFVNCQHSWQKATNSCLFSVLNSHLRQTSPCLARIASTWGDATSHLLHWWAWWIHTWHLGARSRTRCRLVSSVNISFAHPSHNVCILPATPEHLNMHTRKHAWNDGAAATARGADADTRGSARPLLCSTTVREKRKVNARPKTRSSPWNQSVWAADQTTPAYRNRCRANQPSSRPGLCVVLFGILLLCFICPRVMILLHLHERLLRNIRTEAYLWIVDGDSAAEGASKMSLRAEQEEYNRKQNIETNTNKENIQIEKTKEQKTNIETHKMTNRKRKRLGENVTRRVKRTGIKGRWT